jgi:hypothetical protein
MIEAGHSCFADGCTRAIVTIGAVVASGTLVGGAPSARQSLLIDGPHDSNLPVGSCVARNPGNESDQVVGHLEDAQHLPLLDDPRIRRRQKRRARRVTCARNEVDRATVAVGTRLPG